MEKVKNELEKKIDIKLDFYNLILSKHKKYIVDQAYLISKNIQESLMQKGKILICGNGGSNSQASHLCAELMIRFKPNSNRPSFPALSLGSDSSITTACANDYEYENIFSKQLEVLLQKKDFFISFSTSGKSKNIRNALDFASKILPKERIFLITGYDKFETKEFSTVYCPENGETDIYQEYHLLLIHMICHALESTFK